VQTDAKNVVFDRTVRRQTERSAWKKWVEVGSGTYNGTVQQNLAWSTPVVDRPWQKFARQDYKRYPQEIGAEQVQ
jgi:hypothetical protein